MMRSLFAGVSALRNHQVRMDVIGNNIANVNTPGFKGSQVQFVEMVSQTLRDATAPRGDRGGTNPFQVGLGMGLGGVSTNYTPGNLQSTGLATDLAIEGDGFFVLGDGLERYYTRAGMFTLDRAGNLVSTATGLKVLGWTADENGNVDTNQPVGPVTAPKGTPIDARAATQVVFGGNLDARLTGELGYTPSTVTVTDGDGNEVRIAYTWTPTGNFNEWRWEIHVESPAGADVSPANFGTIRLDADGQIVDVSEPGPITIAPDPLNPPTITIDPPQMGGLNQFELDIPGGNPANEIVAGEYEAAEEALTSIRVFDSLGSERELFFFVRKTGDNQWAWRAEDEIGQPVGSGTLQFNSIGRLIAQTGTVNLPAFGGADPMTITPDFSQATQYGDDTTFLALLQDGYPSGTLKTIGIDSNGLIVGSFSNGLDRVLGQVALATFPNVEGLRKVGDTMFQISHNSGSAQIGAPGTGTRGSLSTGSLEMSNVDLSQEFTNMIITQRGFQANSRIITTSDEMLQELVNLKR